MNSLLKIALCFLIIHLLDQGILQAVTTAALQEGRPDGLTRLMTMAQNVMDGMTGQP
ncbi:MAG: hypothetical protein KDI44_16360 [Thiothrix sp.]|nr:hypothetical protein [Thiothrix sp.]